MAEYYLRSLEPLGVPIATGAVTLAPRAHDLAELRRYVGASSHILLVHPGTRSALRRWPAERFAAVIDFAQDELGAQVILVGGASDEMMISEIRRSVRTHLLEIPGPITVARIAALARLSTVMLGHDSGPMHVAAAVGTPVIALYGSQNAALFRPSGTGHIVLQPSLPCHPCLAPNVCVAGDSYRTCCVGHISVEQVCAALQQSLAARRNDIRYASR